MDHETAERLRAPERYVIGEMSASERDEFEEHFADCTHCLENVWAATVFAANAREVFRSAPPNAHKPARKFRWRDLLGFGPVPALAWSGALNLLLIGGLGYSVWLVQPSLRTQLHALGRPRATQVFQLPGLTRAATPVFTTSAASGAIVLKADLPRAYSRYSYSILDASGAVRTHGALEVAAGSDTLSVLVPVAGLAAGEYQFRLEGSDGAQSETIAAARLQVRPN